jgi:uncharacterized protein YaeQ
VALSSTLYNFDIDLADADRGVYESLALRVARHPSESDEFLVARVLAYCLEYGEGLSFSRGLAEPDEPALAVVDLTGALQTWIDIGAPDAARLHKAGKAAARVAVYTHRDPTALLRQLNEANIHRADALEIYAVDRPLLAALAERLERRMTLGLTVTDRHLFATIGEANFNGVVTRLALA